MKKVIKSIYIELEIWELARKIAKAKNRSISTLIEELIKEAK